MATDEFGFPLTAIGANAKARGVRPTEGEYGIEASDSRPGIRENLSEPGMGFTLAEYLDAHFELVCLKLRTGEAIR